MNLERNAITSSIFEKRTSEHHLNFDSNGDSPLRATIVEARISKKENNLNLFSKITRTILA